MKRSLQIVALERRVTMSAGINHLGGNLPCARVDFCQECACGGDVVRSIEGSPRRCRWARLHPEAPVAAKKVSVIKGSFAGGTSELVDGGPLIYMTGSSGKIGKVSFGAIVEGEVSGNNFLGGSLNLLNSQGTIIASLGPAALKKSGKAKDLKVIFVFDDATECIIPAEGSAGAATIKLGLSKSGAKAVAQAEPIWDFKTHGTVSALSSTVSIRRGRARVLLRFASRCEAAAICAFSADTVISLPLCSITYLTLICFFADPRFATQKS